MTIWLPVVVIFGGVFLWLALGLPIAFALGSSAIVTTLIFQDPGTLGLIYTSTYRAMLNMVLVALPLFLFMAAVLEKCGVADALYAAMHHWMGSLRGGLSMATILICTVIAAMSGVAAAGTVTMGMVALPIMLKRGYHKSMAIGPIMAGGGLGILIPPSVSFIIYGMLTKTSIGRLFAGGLIPGLILASLYIGYIGIRSYFQPQLGPAIPPEERISFREKVILSKGLILPILLIVGVLGSIFLGIASPTEGAAIGAAGALVSAAIHRRLSWQMLKEACLKTITINGMVMWIIFGAMSLSSIFVSTGSPQVVRDLILGLDVEPIYVVLVMMASYYVLGCVVDEITILMITLPIYLPILLGLGYDPVWFGVLFIINMQTAMMTPPFGYCLFYMKGVAPPEVSIGDIYKSVPPYIALQVVGLIAVLFFPQLALWLPNVVFKV